MRRLYYRILHFLFGDHTNNGSPVRDSEHCDVCSERPEPLNGDEGCWEAMRHRLAYRNEQLTALQSKLDAALDAVKRRDAVISEALAIVQKEGHDCGCTQGSFMYGCNHLHRRIVEILETKLEN